jgi:hypothetical protein
MARDIQTNVRSRFQRVITFVKNRTKRLCNAEISQKHPKQTEHVVEQSPPAYSVDEKNLLQQSSAQLTIKVLGDSARILLEGREAIARAVESEKALLRAGDKR